MSGPEFPHAGWRTSSYTTGAGNCVEVAFVDAPWRTSSRSTDNGQCVEVAVGPDAVAVRDSKDRTGPVLVVGRAGWAALLGGIRRGELDPS